MTCTSMTINLYQSNETIAIRKHEVSMMGLLGNGTSQFFILT